MTQASDPTNAVCCRGLVKRYGDVVAVAALDLEVRRGECFGLARTKRRGQDHDRGDLRRPAGPGRRRGRGAWRVLARRRRARLGIQLQETKFPDKLGVSEVVTFFRSFYPHGLEVVNVLALVGLEEKARSAFDLIHRAINRGLDIGIESRNANVS